MPLMVAEVYLKMLMVLGDDSADVGDNSKDEDVRDRDGGTAKNSISIGSGLQLKM